MINHLIRGILIAVVALANVNLAFAQSDEAVELKNRIWNKAGEEFSVTEVPEKWADKSAVYIARHFEQSYRKQPILAYLDYFNLSHQRVKIQEKSALEDYSEFSIPIENQVGNISYKFFAGFKIIKPDGSEIEIPLSEGVRENREVNNTKFDLLKLAIPNLEVGDILDYYIAESQLIGLGQKFYFFDPMIFQLSASYPIIHQKITFDISRRCFLNIKSLNGAPQFKRVVEEENDFYTLIDKDREEVEDLRWFYKNRQLPSVKYKVTYASAGVQSMLPLFLGEQREMKTEVTPGDLRKWLKELSSGGYWNGNLYAASYKKLKKEQDKKKVARELFYILRNEQRIDEMESKVIENESQNPSAISYKHVFALSYNLKKHDIPHHIIVGIPRSISEIDDLILENELAYMLKLELDSTYYLGSFDNLSSFGEGNYQLEGTTVFQADGFDSPYDYDFKKVTIPVTPHDRNKSDSYIDLKITEDQTLQASVKKVYSGYSKIYSQNLLLDYYDYYNEENDRYSIENTLPYNRKKLELYQSKKAAYKESLSKEKEDFLKSEIESDFGYEVDEVKNIKILKTGRFDEESEFSYSYETDLSEVMKKLGTNYLVNVGQLIGAQVDIEKDETERAYDIDMPYARSFVHQISLDIPEGYEVQGLDKLNVAVENEFGGFVASTELKDNQLVLKTKKYYTTNFVEKENWGKMLEFLKEAKDFNGKSLLLKKI